MLCGWSARCDREKRFRFSTSGHSTGAKNLIKYSQVLVTGELQRWTSTGRSSGVHRLGRNRRSTANKAASQFSPASFVPRIADTATIEINPATVQSDTVPGAARGGQNVNKVENCRADVHSRSGMRCRDARPSAARGVSASARCENAEGTL